MREAIRGVPRRRRSRVRLGATGRLMEGTADGSDRGGTEALHPGAVQNHEPILPALEAHDPAATEEAMSYRFRDLPGYADERLVRVSGGRVDGGSERATAHTISASRGQGKDRA